MSCLQKHAHFQPDQDEWRCPVCGADNRDFVVEASACEDDGTECNLLHEDDEILCMKCNKSWSGKKVAEMLGEKSGSNVCPCCKGTGRVKKGVACPTDINCSLCGKPVDLKTAHLHQGAFIGECCWDDRLKASE